MEDRIVVMLCIKSAVPSVLLTAQGLGSLPKARLMS